MPVFGSRSAVGERADDPSHDGALAGGPPGDYLDPAYPTASDPPRRPTNELAHGTSSHTGNDSFSTDLIFYNIKYRPEE